MLTSFRLREGDQLLRSAVPQALLCMYDWRRFGGGMLWQAVKTHPKILINNHLMYWVYESRSSATGT